MEYARRLYLTLNLFAAARYNELAESK